MNKALPAKNIISAGDSEPTKVYSPAVGPAADKSKKSQVKPPTTSDDFLAETPTGIFLEKVLIPWAPRSTEALYLFLGIFSFLMVLPFVETRIRRGLWIGEFVQQRFINWVMTIMGFEPFFGGDYTYLPYGTDQQNPTRPGINLVFCLHAGFGLGWIIFGTMQMVMFKKGTSLERYHRRFGYFSMLIFFGHVSAAVYTLYKDIVHHHPLVRTLLFSDLVYSSCYMIGGIIAIKNGNLEKHRDMMTRGYLHSIEGSGTIRLTGYVLWIIGRNLPLSLRILVDPTSCQSEFINASAAGCVVPYTLRLQLLRILTLYFHALYYRTPEKSKDRKSKTMLLNEIAGSFKFLCISMMVILIIMEVPQFAWLKEASKMGGPIHMAMASIYVVNKVFTTCEPTKKRDRTVKPKHEALAFPASCRVPLKLMRSHSTPACITRRRMVREAT